MVVGVRVRADVAAVQVADVHADLPLRAGAEDRAARLDVDDHLGVHARVERVVGDLAVGLAHLGADDVGFVRAHCRSLLLVLPESVYVLTVRSGGPPDTSEIDVSGGGSRPPKVKSGTERPSDTGVPVRDDPSVVALVTRAAGADERAWNELVDRYAPLVWSICVRYQLGGADIEDVGQTVWLGLVEQLANEKLREPAALPGWLATTTQRECLRVAGRAASTKSSPPIPTTAARPRRRTPW